MSRPLKLLLGFLLCILVMAGLILLVPFYVPEENLHRQEADLQVAATELYTTYEADEAMGNRRYIDRIIDVTGTIAEITEDENGAAVVILRESDAFSGVLCTLEESERRAARELAVGQSVTIRGFCTGMLMDVVLNKCIILD